MAEKAGTRVWELLGRRFKSHPWHGVDIGTAAPEIVAAFIEIIPTDTVKYEIDKVSGYLKIDRPQKFSNIVPAMYGFIPQTYCNKAVAELCMQKTGLTNVVGDKDPLDICVLTSRDITHGDIIVKAIPVGGFRMIDNAEADDKIIAVLQDDDVFGQWTDVSQLPEATIDRLRHYFLTYKQLPGDRLASTIAHTYGRGEAHEVIRASCRDYVADYGGLQEDITSTFREWLLSSRSDDE